LNIVRITLTVVRLCFTHHARTVGRSMAASWTPAKSRMKSQTGVSYILTVDGSRP
jgi:hypothetical protein